MGLEVLSPSAECESCSWDFIVAKLIVVYVSDSHSGQKVFGQGVSNSEFGLGPMP